MDDLPAPLTIETRLTRKDRMVHFLCHHLPWIWMPWIVSLLLGVYIAWVVSGPETPLHHSLAWGAVAFWGAFVCVFVLSSVLFAFRLWRVPDDSLALKPMTIHIDAAGYRNEIGGTKSEYSWAQIDKVILTRRFVRLTVAPDGAVELLIPRGAVSDAGVAAIQGFFDASRKKTDA